MFQTKDTVDRDQVYISVHGETSKVFQIQACSNAHIFLVASMRYSSNYDYEIHIQNNNKQTAILDASTKAVKAVEDTVDILSCTEPKYFWVSWGKKISFGSGHNSGENTLVSFIPDEATFTNELSLSTSESNIGTWIAQSYKGQ